jgi:hypothetical protein
MRRFALEEVSFGFLILFSFTSLCANIFARNKFHVYINRRRHACLARRTYKPFHQPIPDQQTTQFGSKLTAES